MDENAAAECLMNYRIHVKNCAESACQTALSSVEGERGLAGELHP